MTQDKSGSDVISSAPTYDSPPVSIPADVAVLIDRHADAWHHWKRASKIDQIRAAENVTRARIALDNRIRHLLAPIVVATKTALRHP